MAGKPATELEARLTEIQKDVALWSQLPECDKKQSKALGDQKSCALPDHAPDKNIKKSNFLKRCLELRKTLKAASLDLRTVDTLIAEEVERRILAAGLQYEEASTSVNSAIPARLLILDLI